MIRAIAGLLGIGCLSLTAVTASCASSDAEAPLGLAPSSANKTPDGETQDAPPAPEARLPPGDVTLTIDATRKGFAIPANYVGLSVSRDHISGSHGYQQLFDPSKNANYTHLVNLLEQIGVKHLRTVSGQADPLDPDPSNAQDDLFFNFASNVGILDHSVIYSLHLFAANSGIAGSDNLASAAYVWTTTQSKARTLLESFALDNESDWKFHYRPPYLDSHITGYDTPAGGGYRDDWTRRYDDIQTKLGNPSPAAPFSGPDTGSSYPIKTDDASNTSIKGVPFTLRFATDQSSRVRTATQHFYTGDSSETPSWVPGAPYFVGDQVLDPKTLYPSTDKPVPFVCIRDVGMANTHPGAVPATWAPVTPTYPLWVSGTTYQAAAIVQDAQAKGNFYQDKTGGVSTAHPSSDSSRWKGVSDPSQPSARQLAQIALAPARITDWHTLYDNALANASGWPAGTAYRLTESTAFSNGGGNPDVSPNGNPANQMFATALWGLDYFHWWAAHGAAGIDPFTRTVQRNAPIYQVNGDFVAEPYAYGMKAFALGSHGAAIREEAVQFDSRNANLTAYAVLDTDSKPNHLYVTLINKTFMPGEARDMTVTIAKPNGFSPTRASYVLLASAAPGSPSDATASTANLGGVVLTNDSSEWRGTWAALLVANGACAVRVPATTAAVVDLQL